jgi:hypothetical protein
LLAHIQQQACLGSVSEILMAIRLTHPKARSLKPGQSPNSSATFGISDF